MRLAPVSSKWENCDIGVRAADSVSDGNSTIVLPPGADNSVERATATLFRKGFPRSQALFGTAARRSSASMPTCSSLFPRGTGLSCTAVAQASHAGPDAVKRSFRKVRSQAELGTEGTAPKATGGVGLSSALWAKDNSPAIHRWGKGPIISCFEVPPGTAEQFPTR